MARDDRDYVDDTTVEGERPEGHATTGGSAAAGAVTGGVIGLAGGPVGAVVGAVGGAVVGAIAERIMHGQEGHEHITGDEEHYVGDHEHAGDDDGHDHRYHYDTGMRGSSTYAGEDMSARRTGGTAG